MCVCVCVCVWQNVVRSHRGSLFLAHEKPKMHALVAEGLID